MSSVPMVKVVIEPVAYGGWYVTIPSRVARAKCARGPYGEDAPVTDDVAAYVQSDDDLRLALGDSYGRASRAAFRWGSASVLLTVDDASALWRWNLSDAA